MQPGTFSDPTRSRGRQPRSSLQTSATTSRSSASPPFTHSQSNSLTQYHQPSQSSSRHVSPPSSQYHAIPDHRSFTTNQNRMEAAIRHRSPSPQLPANTRQLRPSGGISVNPFGTLPTITVPRDTTRSHQATPSENRSHRRSHTQPSSTTLQSRRGNITLSAKYIFCINPVPVRNPLIICHF